MTDDLIQTARRRLTAGEALSQIANDLGCTWQWLSKALRGRTKPGSQPSPQPAAVREAPQVQPTASDVQARLINVSSRDLQPLSRRGPLTERYRPQTLSTLFGQPAVAARLARFVADPYPEVFLFAGETGTGKTSAAIALANELGCDLSSDGLGGLTLLASGEQTTDHVRDTWQRLRLRPLTGSGWRVVVVNEADRMHLAAETIWLDRLENLPCRCVVVFTTNFPDKLSDRFRDRCTTLRFEHETQALTPAAAELAASIWKSETGSAPGARLLLEIVEQANVGGRLSFRRLVQSVHSHLMERPCN